MTCKTQFLRFGLIPKHYHVYLNSTRFKHWLRKHSDILAIFCLEWSIVQQSSKMKSSACLLYNLFFEDHRLKVDKNSRNECKHWDFTSCKKWPEPPCSLPRASWADSLGKTWIKMMSLFLTSEIVYSAGTSQICFPCQGVWKNNQF